MFLFIHNMELDLVLFLAPQTALADEGVSLNTAVSPHISGFVSLRPV